MSQVEHNPRKTKACPRCGSETYVEWNSYKPSVRRCMECDWHVVKTESDREATKAELEERVEELERQVRFLMEHAHLEDA